jgi:HlyD family secretion protein
MKNWIVCIVALIVSPTLWAADESATLQWSQRVELSLPVSGVVQNVNVNAGQVVKKGQVLLSLDNTIYQSKVTENQAVIKRLVAEFEEAKRDFDRVHELHERTVVATAELDQAKLRLTRTETLLAEANANLKQQQKMLNDSILRAPYDALVLSRQAEVGMSVAAGLQPQILMVLAKSGEMLARLYLPVSQIEKLQSGQSVTVLIGKESYAGKIKALGWEPLKIKDENVYQVDVSFASVTPLRAGTPALVKLP